VAAEPTRPAEAGAVPSLRVDAVSAIDVHVHVEASVTGSQAPQHHSDLGMALPTVPELADLYRGLGMAAVVFPVDAPHTLGSIVSNEEVADLAAEAPDVLIPFASVDPVRRSDPAATARALVDGHGVRGFKFHPGAQEFFPNDASVYPLYEALEEAGAIALFHTGKIGGGPVRLKYCDPLALDDVAVDFPDLKIVMAHPSFPWQDTALAIAATRPNVFIDLSGWSPRYFPPQLIEYSNTLLKEKVMFGSDYPIIDPERWLRDFAAAPFRDEVRQGILKDNAARLLGLA